MNILVTGGAGFIGSHLCDKLIELGHRVTCIDNLASSSRENIEHLLRHPRFDFIRHDVCDEWNIQCDQIFHLACPASPVQYQRNPVHTIRTAVMGTYNALESARYSDARILITSTSEVYGDPQVHPQPETYWGHVNPVGPRSCYDEGKRCAESLAVAHYDQHRTRVRIARLFNTYGPRMALNDGRLIPNFISQAMEKKPLTIYGDGNQTRSFCYVSDTIDALLRLMASDSRRLHPILNIGNPDERTIKSVAYDVISAFGGEGTLRMEPLPMDDPKQRCPDISQAKVILNWEPKVSYTDGIAKTIAWYLKRARGD